MSITETEYDQATRNTDEQRQSGYAVAARYDVHTGKVVVDLNTEVQITFPAHKTEGLAEASPNDLAVIEITPSGLGLHWPKLDADLYVPGLMAGQLGSRSWMASQLGAIGGRVCTPAKAISSRTNGRKGGRPKVSHAAS